MTALSDERFIEHLEQVFEDAMRGVAYLGVGVKAVAEAAIAADRAQGAEPVAWCWLYDGKPGQPFYGTGPTADLIKLAAARDNPVTVRYFYPRSQPVAVPDGCVVVPVRPTEEMLESARLATESEGLTTTTWLRDCVYRAMLAASPSPETQT